MTKEIVRRWDQVTFLSLVAVQFSDKRFGWAQDQLGGGWLNAGLNTDGWTKEEALAVFGLELLQRDQLWLVLNRTAAAPTWTAPGWENWPGDPDVESAVAIAPASIKLCHEWSELLHASVPENLLPGDKLARALLQQGRVLQQADLQVVARTVDDYLASSKAATLKQYQRTAREWPYCDVHMTPKEFAWKDKSYVVSVGSVRCPIGAKGVGE